MKALATGRQASQSADRDTERQQPPPLADVDMVVPEQLHEDPVSQIPVMNAKSANPKSSSERGETGYDLWITICKRWQPTNPVSADIEKARKFDRNAR